MKHIKGYKKCRNCVCGQIMPIVAVTALLLFLFAIVAFNIGEIEYSRQKTQTAADAAAISSARCMAAAYNKIGKLNIATHVGAIIYVHNWKKALYVKNILGVPVWPVIEAASLLVKGLRIAAPMFAGASYWAAASDNDATGIPYVPGMFSTQLKEQELDVLACEYVLPGPPPIYIIPMGITYSKRALYLARDWVPGTRKAQPEYKATGGCRREVKTFLTSLLGVGSGSLYTYGTAEAKTFLDMKQSAPEFFHNGGFPRYNESEGMYGFVLEPMGTQQFDAGIIKSPIALYH
jgi:hypothetical protein